MTLLKRWCLLILLVSFQAVSATGTDFHVYYLGGQSNMDGYGYVDQLPGELASPSQGILIFHGNTSPDNTDVDGKGIWKPLQPGHGVGFKSNGQSNQYSNRFGVELTFAKTIQQKYPERRIAIIKYSRGGTSIAEEAAGGFGCWEPDFEGQNGVNQYDHFLATVRGAMSTADIDGDGTTDRLIPAGIVWMQGESDAQHTEAIADLYQSNLRRLMDLIRAALRYDDLPVVIGEISDSKKRDGIWKFGDRVRKAQADYVTADGNASLVTTTKQYDYSDPWHYDSAGYIDLGKQFAEHLIKLSAGRGNN